MSYISSDENDEFRCGGCVNDGEHLFVVRYVVYWYCTLCRSCSFVLLQTKPNTTRKYLLSLPHDIKL